MIEKRLVLIAIGLSLSLASAVSNDSQINVGQVDQSLTSETDVCSVILKSWWDQRANFENSYPYTNNEMREHCAQYSKENAENPDEWSPEVCYGASKNEGNAFTICTIQGAGNPTLCVPASCAFLNQGACSYNLTGGACQWFDSVPTVNGKTLTQGCYRNPCNLGGLSNNNADYCNTNQDFIDFNSKYKPAVKCTWCQGHTMGCQNIDPFPKSGCATINKNDVNNYAKEQASKGIQEGTIITMSSKHPNYNTATICADPSKVLNHGNAAQCIFGQVGCGQEQLDDGFKYKFPFNSNARDGRRLRGSS